MANMTSRTVSDQDERPNWRALPPGLGVRSLGAVALAVPILVAAGVYWLHQLPAGPGLRANDNIIDVHLIGPQLDTVDRVEAARPQQTQRQQQAEKLVQDPRRALPDQVVAALPSEPERQAPPAAAAVAPPPSVSKKMTDQKAALFQRELLSHIARYRRYPDAARHDRAEGIVRLLFSMRRDGTVTNVQVASSSGFPLLDLAAIETIQKAQPMPRIPAELPDQLNVLVPVAFDLSR